MNSASSVYQTGRHKFPQIYHLRQFNLSWQTGYKSAFQALTCKMCCICQLSISGRETDPACPDPQNKGSTSCKGRWDKGLSCHSVRAQLPSMDTHATSEQPFPDHGKQQNSETSHRFTPTCKQTLPSTISQQYLPVPLETKELNQECFLNTLCSHSFFPMSRSLQLGKKTTLLPTQRAQNSLSSMPASLQTVL